MRLQEIEEAFTRFRICPKCNSKQGFWLGAKRDLVYVQCKGCGARYELHEVYRISEEGKAPQRLRFFRR
ncbi:MAG: hypothetical protein QXH37_03860 [Candidatus Bathyarchaeia archaeon]